MSNTHSLKGVQQARTEPAEESKRLEEKRRSLEGKTRILEEQARVEKLAVDKRLLGQILQEENRTHDAAIRELEEKIADLEEQMKPSFTEEDIRSQTLSEPAKEIPEPAKDMSEPAKEVSDNVNEDESVGELQERARMLLQESDRTRAQGEVETPQENKKKKRGLF